MENALIALAETVHKYKELHYKCFELSPEECKELMTLGFPVIQGFQAQSLISLLGSKTYDKTKVFSEIREYLDTASKEKGGSGDE